ncbi:MAG TPA: hypothetical protein VI277_09150 [Candidatus Limnocylindria bacterium]
MTITTFAARADRSDDLGSAYEPGVCNIGREEIARRRMAGHVGAALTLAGLAVLVAIDAPPLARLVLLLPAAVSASGYIQARLKFCAAYGQRGMFNFGGRSDAIDVDDPEARARDRRRARQISLASFGIGLLVAVGACLLPI